MSNKLHQTIAFTKLLHAFQREERAIRVPGLDRLENDAEHSYALAMLAWYLIDTMRLPLDKKKVFEYALAHDMVEVYAGDTPAFGRGGSNKADIRSSKKEREELAKKRLRSEFPEFPSFTDAMEIYEKQADKESKFVYALDKLIPIFGGIAHDGRDWKEHGISFQEVLSYKLEKIKANESVFALFNDIMSLIGKDKARYFNL